MERGETRLETWRERGEKQLEIEEDTEREENLQLEVEGDTERRELMAEYSVRHDRAWLYEDDLCSR